jgi:PAS domain S-box-containing protein
MSCIDHLSELEALRLQVADLTRALAERDQSLSAERHQFEKTIRNFHEQSHRLRTIVEGTAAETGDGFFTSLVRYLTATVHVQYALIGEVSEGQSKKIRTLAVSAGGLLVDNFEYELAHTPCATALTETVACFDRDVQATFPQFQRLADLGAQSYCAVPLRTKGGAVIGLLAVMDTKPLQQSDDLQSLLGVLAPRVAAEFERKRVEEEHTQALADLRNVVETVPDVMFTLDTQGNMVKWNRRVVDVTGYSPEELLNMPALAFVPPEEQPRTAEAIQRAFTEGYAELDGYLLTKGHRVIPYHWTGAVLKNLHGEPIGITGIGRDVSAKRQAEEAVQKSERRYATLLGNLNGMAYRCWNDKDWTMDYVSEGCLALVGYPAEDLLGNAKIAFGDLVHPDDGEWLWEKCNAHLRAHRPCTNEYRILTAGGTVKWVWDQAQGIYSDTGELLAIEGFVTDITGRKRAEHALRASEERFDLAVRGSNTGIWDWDIRTGETYFSPLWKSMLGYERHELRGELFEWEQRLHPDDRERSSATVRAYLEGRTPQYELEHRLRHKDGSYRWILARGVSICDKEGKPYRMAGSHIDITDLKQTQEVLAQRERQLQTVLDALPMGVWFTDGAGRVLLANPAARQIWSGIRQVGVETGANVAGWWEATGPSGDLHRWVLSQALTKGIPSPHETLDLECLDGTKKTIRNSAVPVRDEAGVVVGALVLNEEITSLRQAQEAIRLTQFSVDHAVEAFFWIDHQGNILNVNESACRMLEHSREELITMTLHDIDLNFPPELWPTHWAELKEKGSITFESKLWSHQGHVIDTEVTFNYLRYDGHEYNCAIMRDIGERRRAQEALLKSEVRLRTITDAVPGAVYQYQLSPDGTQRFLFMSQGIQGLVGVTSAEGENGFSSIWDHVLPEEVEDLWASIRESSETLSPWKHEFRILHADGTTRWISGSSIPESPREGDSILWNGILIDITDRKRMEETLRQQERDLRAALEERERISQDLHDGILQSLFAVGLALESVKLTMSARNLKTSRASLNQAINQLNDVMREIRNFIAGLGSDLLKGRDLPAALRHMLETMTENQATRVRLAVEDRAAKALSTEQSLHLLRVIQEAVGNCIRHGRAQEARVSLKMLKQGVRLSIRDDGRGFNLSAAKGAGHGLTNMAARAQKMGGRLTLSSKMNEGTRVVLDLPTEIADVRR